MTQEQIVEALTRQAIETPSWGYGNSGTRFKTFAAPGAARTVWEKVSDAAEVHRLSGIAPSVALHIPWDEVDDWTELRDFADSHGIRIGSINPNLFQDEEYRLGSLCHPDAEVRDRALEHVLDCCRIMTLTGSKELSLWLADVTNYVGQDDLRARKQRLAAALQTIHSHLPEGGRMLVEYKFYEPAFYATDLFDWGASVLHCQKAGPNAQVLVDLGHHAQGTNIEAIVAFLLDEGRLGGFHFNARRYGDDDLIVGTTNPFELFCIYSEIVGALTGSDPTARETAESIAFMIDQSHNIEPKIEAMLQSVLNCQTAYAKALSIDRAALAHAQAAGDVLEAHRCLQRAFEADVSGLIREARRRMEVPEDPISTHRASGLAARLADERGTQTGGGGYPVKTQNPDA
ncbi:MAG: L-rhamnose isomerase [Fimbriimonadaceae bacterium]|nr:L-rhamnose isomerase [Fimbriimonadaceae bacterium]